MKKPFLLPLLLSVSLLTTACANPASAAQSIPTEASIKQYSEVSASISEETISEETISEETIAETATETIAFSESELVSWNKTNTIPAYSGQTYEEVNDNVPYFTSNDLTQTVFERYSDLDEYGRCGQAYANICPELMPTEERGEIGMIKPSGWHTVKYPDVIEDNYLYNRCHLIGFQLAGENANEKNLITGTRYLNVTGMLPFENEVADYVRSTGNHVLYRVTPLFVADELTCRGVEMEAVSVEDKGEGVRFHVFVYNEQPGIVIDHLTGDSYEESDGLSQTETAVNISATSDENEYVLNLRSHKFHYPDCEGVSTMSEKNKEVVFSDRQSLIEKGYSPCGTCNP